MITPNPTRTNPIGIFLPFVVPEYSTTIHQIVQFTGRRQEYPIMDISLNIKQLMKTS